MSEVDFALALLRVWVGVVMLAHGINHARSLEGTARWLESKGFKSAPMNARLSAGSEVAIALGLIFGLLTTFALAGVAATMLVAFWSVHRFSGFFVFRRPDEGFEYVATLAVVSVALAILGPGGWSLDSAFGIADDFDGWLGAGIVALGFVAGLGQIAAFWRPQTPKVGV